MTLTLVGRLTDEGLLELHELLRSDPAVRPEHSLLIDLRQATGGGVSAAGVRSLSERPLPLSVESRRAVVVPSDLGFGMARMYETLRDQKGGAVRAFRDFVTAERWVRGEDE